MPDTDQGPPEKEDGPGTKSEATTTAAKHADSRNDTALPRQCAADTRPWRQRRQASYRLIPLDCGCRDPWPCRCTVPPLSDKTVDAGRAAALHVLDQGRVPLLELEVLRALYRRGGLDRQLAEQLHRLTGGAVA